MIQLSKTGVQVEGDLSALQAEFARNDVVRLPGLLSRHLVALALARVETGPWRENVHTNISRELLLNDALALQMLHFVTDSPAFLSVIRRLTGCVAASCFRGRVYRMPPGRDYEIPWHTDISDAHGRLLGMSVNLSTKPYTGGLFQISRRGSKAPAIEMPNTTLGDAILFRINPELHHRVTHVEGEVAKTAFAGWFHSVGSDFLDRLKSEPAPSAD